METSAQQYQRLYEILHHYRLKISHLEVLQNHGSLVARVETPDTPYVLRICYPLTALARVQEELDWLLALQHDTDLVVPSPVANEQGAFITSWRASELDSVQHCVLFNWVEGHSVRDSMSQETAESVGVLLSRLHRHAQSYTPPHASAFLGPRYHADLHFDNILLQNNRYALIDFGDCSLGYYLHDLAITEQAFRHCFDNQHIITAFHEGYCQERNIPLSFLRDIDAFMIPVDVLFLEWILSTDNSEARELLLSRVPQKIEHILESAERARRTL